LVLTVGEVTDDSGAM